VNKMVNNGARAEQNKKEPKSLWKSIQQWKHERKQKDKQGITKQTQCD